VLKCAQEINAGFTSTGDFLSPKWHSELKLHDKQRGINKFHAKYEKKVREELKKIISKFDKKVNSIYWVSPNTDNKIKSPYLGRIYSFARDDHGKFYDCLLADNMSYKKFYKLLREMMSNSHRLLEVKDDYFEDEINIIFLPQGYKTIKGGFIILNDNSVFNYNECYWFWGDEAKILLEQLNKGYRYDGCQEFLNDFIYDEQDYE
jgi:hypothetical protein